MKNLRHLELADVNDKPWPRTGFDKLLPLAGQLKVFKFNRSAFSFGRTQAVAEPTWLEIVAKFTALETLELRKAGLADNDLSLLSGLAHLGWLDLGGNPISGPGLAHLKPLVKLESLELQDTLLADPAAAAVKELPPSVITIGVRGTKLTKPVPDDLEKSRKWKYFYR